MKHGRGKAGEGMWISKRKLEALEKRIADLEQQVQSQQKKIDAFCEFVSSERRKALAKSGPVHRWT